MKTTEKENKRSNNLSKMSSLEIVSLMNDEDRKVIKSINKKKVLIASIIDECVKTYKKGGHIYYVGAGSSGRYAMADIVELVPTFNDTTFRCLLSGGKELVYQEITNAEDDTIQATNDFKEITKNDFVIGIAASGSTPYVIKLLELASANNIPCSLITSNSVDVKCTYNLFLDTGSEILTGSTRLKAASAVKMVLNMISTATMAQVGKIYKNYMVDMVVSNSKLQKRAVDIVCKITSCKRNDAKHALKDSKNNIKLAIVMISKNVDASKASDLLMQNDNNLEKII